MITLGIDAGGTYTDVAICDRKNNNILDKNKVLTTNGNLTKGINNALNGLKEEYFDKIELVALSSTLATNAMVEGKGARVGLILLGYDQNLLNKINSENEILDKKIETIKGKFNVKGEEIEELKKEKIIKIGKKWENEVDAYGISGYMSIRNPKHEKKARETLKKITNKPIVCGHSLTNKLNSIKRANTVLLNARLIPLIKELNQEVKKVLKEKNINVPLMIVKGDGSLVKDNIITNKPIETVASGPAASIIGAKKLSNLKNGIIVDMGGTTTDITLINNGSFEFDSAGSIIGDHRISVETINFKTVGLGGDSRIQIDKYGNLNIGPKRVIPFCLASSKDKNVLKELNKLKNKNTGLKNGEFLILEKNDYNIKLNKEEKKIIDFLETGAKSINEITKYIGNTTADFLEINRLERLDIIKRIGLTPTDLLHVLNEYNKWDKKASHYGLELLLSKMNLEEKKLAKKIKRKFIENCAIKILEMVIKKHSNNFKNEEINFNKDILEMMVDDDKYPWDFNIRIPIVAVGAPASIYLNEAGQLLDANIILNENFEVANAIGAAMGEVLIKEEILIRPNTNDESYFVYFNNCREKIKKLNNAINHAKEIGKKNALNKAKRAGAKILKVKTNINRKEVCESFRENKKLIEIKIEIVISGIPKKYNLKNKVI